jgi:hypothetical protein
MQKLFVRFLFITTIATFSLFTACKKDKDGGTPQEKLVGKWSLEAGYINYHHLGTTQKDTITNTSGNYLQFNADGTTTASEGSEVVTGTWKITDNKLVIIETGDDDSPVGYDIIKLTSNELHLYDKEVTGEDFVEVTMHLKK